MARDTPASVRARYLPVTDDEVTLGAPSDGINYNIILVNRRQQWWWQSGPVDSCCMCFPLETGIVTMAGLKAAWNCVVLLLFGPAKTAKNQLVMELARGLVMKQDEYENNCTGDSPTMPENVCQRLEQQIHTLQNALSSDKHTPAVVYVYECLVYIGLVVGLAGGLAGLWAGCGRSTLAAKLFLWSWLAGMAISITSLAVSLTRGQIGSFGMPVAFVLTAVYYYFIIYFTKVSWSYYAVLKARDINTSSGTGNGVELRGIMNDEKSGAFA